MERTVETSKLKLRPDELSVESFGTQGGADEEGTVLGEQDARGPGADGPAFVPEPDGAADPVSGGPTCADVTCWETCGRTCYDTCRLTDCGF